MRIINSVPAKDPVVVGTKTNIIDLVNSCVLQAGIIRHAGHE
jgi:hypothetical protein